MGALGVTRGAQVGARLFPPASVVREDGHLSSLSTYLAIAAFVMAMLPRLLTAAGAPALVNFLHFPVTLGAVILVAPRMRSRMAMAFLRAFYLLFFVAVASAFLNGAGLINAVLSFLLLVEPFLLLLLLTHRGLRRDQYDLFRRVVLLIASLHVAMAYYQYFGLGLTDDHVKGVFLAQGAGHHVAGAVALTTSAYLLTSTVPRSSFLRIAAAVVCALVVFFSDAKQVTLVFLASLFPLAFRRARIGAVARRVGIAGLVCLAFLGAAQAFLPKLVHGAGWGSLDAVLTGLRHKYSVFLLLESKSPSPLHLLAGLGPGHTCGRLAHLIPDYIAQLEPLGVTKSSVTAEVIRLRESNHLSSSRTGSSLWSPSFFWSGVFGDLGLAGLAGVAILWGLGWRYHAADPLARYLALNVLLFGLVYSWPEEPGYMMFVAALLGLRWQQRHLDQATPR
jgi:hypothetical protein